MTLDNSNAEILTTETALINAARILHGAEIITDLAAMERMIELARAWMELASLLSEHGDN